MGVIEIYKVNLGLELKDMEYAEYLIRIIAKQDQPLT